MRIRIFPVFLAVVFAEIAGFILVGRTLGVLPTLGLVLLGMVGGLSLLRAHGLATLLKVRAETEAGRLPARPLAEGAILALGAILIIVPGFLTDIAGLVLLVPWVRERLWRLLRARLDAAIVRPPVNGAGGVVDLDREDYARRPRSDSPWRRLDRETPT
jgi:UPF0716 protein FxsA